MKVKISTKKEADAVYLKVQAGVRYWEDASVNGEEDEEGDLIPCRDGDYWCPVINIDTGFIKNWPIGVTADIHYKVCDDGNYTIVDKDYITIAEKDGYVPDTMCPEDEGYGDYIIMKVDGNGQIENWKFNINDFLENED